MSLEQKVVIVDPGDNVATALADLKAGETLELWYDGKSQIIELITPIPFGHKLSLKVITAGSPIIKYGETIGIATADIPPGAHVHTQNVVSTRGRGDLIEEKP